MNIVFVLPLLFGLFFVCARADDNSRTGTSWAASDAVVAGSSVLLGACGMAWPIETLVLAAVLALAALALYAAALVAFAYGWRCTHGSTHNDHP